MPSCSTAGTIIFFFTIAFSCFLCLVECGHAFEEPESGSTRRKRAAGAGTGAGDDDGDYVEDDQVRIVNGWKARPRPWMVLIRYWGRR